MFPEQPEMEPSVMPPAPVGAGPWIPLSVVHANVGFFAAWAEAVGEVAITVMVTVTLVRRIATQGSRCPISTPPFVRAPCGPEQPRTREFLTCKLPFRALRCTAESGVKAPKSQEGDASHAPCCRYGATHLPTSPTSVHRRWSAKGVVLLGRG